MARSRLSRTGAALALLLCACGSQGPTPTNVLLVTVDTLRADHLSAYGYEGQATPNIDRLAAQGALFEQAFADTPWTTPSMSSVLTGTYPTRHGFRSTNANRLAASQHTLAEMLKERGYHTAAIIGSFPLDSIYGLDQGFDLYDDHFTRPIWKYPGHEPTPLPSEFREDPHDQAMFAMVKAMSDSRRSDAEVSDAAIEWLETRREPPYFLWVHYFGPHSKPDWSIPEEQRLSVELARYEPDVVTNDREVGRLLDALDALGDADDTLVVFHADHGESLGEQRYVGHGLLLNDATMRIPLILRLPGRIAAGRRVSQLARNVDILPTVLDAVGAPIPDTTSGRSLLPLASGGETAPAPHVQPASGDEPIAYMETFYPAHQGFAKPVKLPDGSERKIGLIRRSVRSGPWQLIRSEPYPLLDVRDDDWKDVPVSLLHSMWSEVLVDTREGDEALRDHSRDHPEIAARLRAALDAELARDNGVAPRFHLDDESKLRLESLGYGR
jgi:arylsulfatase A-like enzyme